MQGGVLHVHLRLSKSHNTVAHITTDETVIERQCGVCAYSGNGGGVGMKHRVVVEDTVLHFHIHCSAGIVAQEEGGALRCSAVGYHAVAYLDVLHRISCAVHNGNTSTSLKGKRRQHTALHGIGKVELQAIHYDIRRTMAHGQYMTSVLGIVAARDVGSDAGGISLGVALGYVGGSERRGKTTLQAHVARHVYIRRADIRQIGISCRGSRALLDKHLHGRVGRRTDSLDIIQGIVDIIEWIVP